MWKSLPHHEKAGKAQIAKIHIWLSRSGPLIFAETFPQSQPLWLGGSQALAAEPGDDFRV